MATADLDVVTLIVLRTAVVVSAPGMRPAVAVVHTMVKPRAGGVAAMADVFVERVTVELVLPLNVMVAAAGVAVPISATPSSPSKI